MLKDDKYHTCLAWGCSLCNQTTTVSYRLVSDSHHQELASSWSTDQQQVYSLLTQNLSTIRNGAGFNFMGPEKAPTTWPHLQGCHGKEHTCRWHAHNTLQETTLRLQGTSISTASHPPQALCMLTSKTRAGSWHSLMEGQTAQMLKVTISHRKTAAHSGKQGKSSLPNLYTKQPMRWLPQQGSNKANTCRNTV